MRKYSMLIVICALFLTALVILSANEQRNNTNIINGYVIKQVFNKCYVEKISDVKHNLFYCEKSVEDLQTLEDKEKMYIEQNRYIIKYAFDEKGNIAYHINDLSSNITEDSMFVRKIGGTEYGVYNDMFVIYNINTGDKNVFKTEDDYVEYCQETSLALFDWIFNSGIEYEKIELISGWHLCLSESVSVPDQIIHNNKVVFEGFISEYEVEDSSVAFRIQIPHKSFLEFPNSSNASLRIGDEAIGKYYEIFPIVHQEVYFDDVVKINMLDNSMC